MVMPKQLNPQQNGNDTGPGEGDEFVTPEFIRVVNSLWFILVDAGVGSRALSGKGPKGLKSVYNKTAIIHCLDELSVAGISPEQVILVVNESFYPRYMDFFTNPEEKLRDIVYDQGKQSRYDNTIGPIIDYGKKIHIIPQEDILGLDGKPIYGSGVAIKSAMNYLRHQGVDLSGTPVGVGFVDDLIVPGAYGLHELVDYCASRGVNVKPKPHQPAVLPEMIDALTSDNQATGVIAAQAVPEQDISSFGILELHDGIHLFRNHEKPASSAEAPLTDGEYLAGYGRMVYADSAFVDEALDSIVAQAISDGTEANFVDVALVAADEHSNAIRVFKSSSDIWVTAGDDSKATDAADVFAIMDGHMPEFMAKALRLAYKPEFNPAIPH